jgi:hypothetical protein
MACSGPGVGMGGICAGAVVATSTTAAVTTTTVILLMNASFDQRLRFT